MDIITQVILPLILAFIMFSMGLSLVIDDFTRVKKFPKAFFTGAVLQIVSLPLVAIAIAKIWTSTTVVDPEVVVGLIVLAACPGGVTSNLFTHLGKGDTALSITLTAIISILSIFTIPLVVNYGYTLFSGSESGSPLPVAKTIAGVFLITTVPVALGMLIRAKKKIFADRFEPLARKIAIVLFVVIIFAAIGKRWDLLSDNILSVGPYTLLLNVFTMGLAYFVAKLMKLDFRDSIAITFECGLQNGTMAIMIAVTFLGSEAMIVPIGIYSILMFVTGGVYLAFLKRAI